MNPEKQPVTLLCISVCLISFIGTSKQAFCAGVVENFEVVGRIGGAFGTFVVWEDTMVVADQGDLVAMDVSDPQGTRPLSRIRPHDQAAVQSLVTYSGLVYAKTSLGLQIYDYTEPSSPTYVGTFAPFATYQPSRIEVGAGRLYFGGDRLQIFDLTDPASPAFLADLPIASQLLAVDGNYIVVPDGAGATVYDLTDPAAPVSTGSLSFDGEFKGAAIRWPAVALMSVEEGTDFYGRTAWFWDLNVYSHDGGTSWTHARNEVLAGYSDPVHSGISRYSLLDLALTSDTVFTAIENSRLATSLWIVAYTRYYLGAYDATNASTHYLKEIRVENLQDVADRLYGQGADSISIFDISDPTTYTLLGSLNALRGILAVGADRLYVARAGAPVVVVDIADPAAPRISGNGPTMSAPNAVTVSGDYLYVADGTAGLRILSLADPDAPVQVAVAKPAANAAVRDVEVVGDRAYVASENHLLHIYSVADPTSPTTLGSLDEYDTEHDALGVAVAGDFAYVLVGREIVVVNVKFPDTPWPVVVVGTEESQHITAVGDRLYSRTIFDLANPAAPVELGSLPRGGRAAIWDDWVFVAEGPNGLRAYWMADPPVFWDGGFVAVGLYDVVTAGDLICASHLDDNGKTADTGIWLLRFLEPAPVDLVPLTFRITAPRAASGETFPMIGTIVNLGPAATTQSLWVEFRGEPVDGGDPVLLCESFLVPADLARDTPIDLSQLNRPLYGPAEGVQPGSYHVSVVVDAAGEIRERSESNNVLPAQDDFMVLPAVSDLRPLSLSFTPSHVGGIRAIGLSGEIEYTGSGRCPSAFDVEFWLSPNSDFSDPRYKLCDPLRVSAGLEPATVHTFQIGREVGGQSPGLADGVYYIGLVVDSSDEVPETEEGNNTLWVTDRMLEIGGTAATNWPLYW